MDFIREEAIGNFTREELIKMVKDCLEELKIAYEEKPGGFGGLIELDPSVFD